MTNYLRPGIHLTEENKKDWKDAGFTIMRRPTRGRERTTITPQEGDLVLNYGSRVPLPNGGYPEGVVVLNDPAKVGRTRVENFIEFLGEVGPPTVPGHNAIIGATPVILKGNGCHGANKTVIQDRYTLPQRPTGPFIVQHFLSPVLEFRVQTIQLPTMEKPKVLSWHSKTVENPLDPSAEKVFHYHRSTEIYEGLHNICRKAHVALGLDFVGWDVLYHYPQGNVSPEALQPPMRTPYEVPRLPAGGTWYIIEGNSAPGLGEVSARRLKRKLEEWGV